MRLMPCAAAAAVCVFAYAHTARADDSTSLQEVVVTATRRETLADQTPMSMTVLGAGTLRSVHADDFSGFAGLVPGLTAIDSGPGQKRYALRGLQSPGEPEVALYYDEIPISGLPGGSLDTGDAQPDFKLVDIARIEVLRGPQGTLYGNGSEGGAIRILSKRPQLDAFSGETHLESAVTEGGAPSWRADQVLNVPLIDATFAIRAVGYYRGNGGWIDSIAQPQIHLPQAQANNINKEETSGARFSARLAATRRWDLAFIAWYQHLATGSTFDIYPSGLGSARYVSPSFVRTPWRDQSQMYNLISNYDLDAASLVVTGSYQRRTVDNNLDSTRFILSQFHCSLYTVGQTCFPPPLAPEDSFSFEKVAAWSGEARLVSRTHGPFQWTVGTSFQNAVTYRRGQVARVDSSGNIQFDPVSGDALDRAFARTNRDQFNQYSFFADTSCLLWKNLTLDVGLRWFHSDRSDEQVIVQQFFPGQPTGPEPFQRFAQGALFKNFRVSYTPMEHVLLYAMAAQGFRAGGPNYPGGFTVTAPPYHADSVWDYEAGWKASFAAGAANWTASVFHIDWSNLQLLVPTALFSYITNAGAAQSDGFETELHWGPSRNIDLTAGVSYANARLVGPQPPAATPSAQLRSGDRLANAPRWTANASAVFKHDIAGLEASVRLDGLYQSSRASQVNPDSPSYFRIGGYVLTNAHLMLASRRGWDVTLDVENLFDRFAAVSAKSLDGNLVSTVDAARPRTISMGIARRY